MRKEQKLVIGFVATLAGVAGAFLDSYCMACIVCSGSCCLCRHTLDARTRSWRCADTLIVSCVNLVALLLSCSGALHVYLPFYSTLGMQAQERAGRLAQSGENEKAKRSASMWKNMDKKAKTDEKERTE